MDRFTRFPGLTPSPGPLGEWNSAAESEENDRSNPLERLVGIVRSNDQALASLTSFRDAIDRARAYLAMPDAHRAIGEAHLEQLKRKRSGVLIVLRANRIEARAILAEVGRKAVADFRPARFDRRDDWAIRDPGFPMAPIPRRRLDSGFAPARR